MKFLLVAINAKYIHSNLAVYSLKAYAERYGAHIKEYTRNHGASLNDGARNHGTCIDEWTKDYEEGSDNCAKNNEESFKNIDIEIAEYTINQYTEDIIRDIYERKPDAIGFSCYIWNIEMVNKICEDFKKISPNVDIWVGGPEVSYNVNQVLDEHSVVDYVIYGEGEETFKNIINAYSNYAGNDKTDKDSIRIETDTLKNIKGIAFRNQGEIVITPMQSPVDLSDVPFVYEDMKEFENKIIYYETSRGCPFSCSYCLSSIDKKLRFRDLAIVKKELKFFIDNKTAQVKFVDRTFNCKHDHAMEIWRFIKENDNGITNFHFEIAADLMTEDEIKLISTMRPGLIQLEIGVQSTNGKTLEAINRKTDIKKISKVTEKIRCNRNIHQHLDLIAGLPYENFESFKKSFNEVYAMKPDQLQLGFLKVLHGSAMKEKSQEYDVIYSSMAPYEVLSTHWISYGELLKLKAVETVVEIYYNSFQFDNTIRHLEREFDSAFAMYEKLGIFYKKHSINGEKHSRVSRYNLLLEFIEDEGIDVVSYKQLLTLDFYLRENAKTRPDFAKDILAYKKKVREWMKSEKIREILPDYEGFDSKQIEKMTHVEVFEKDGNEIYILFDYKNRSPLNKQARIVDITEMIAQQ